MATLSQNRELNGVDTPDKDNFDGYPQIYTELHDKDFILSGKAQSVKLTKDYLRFWTEGKGSHVK